MVVIRVWKRRAGSGAIDDGSCLFAESRPFSLDLCHHGCGPDGEKDASLGRIRCLYMRSRFIAGRRQVDAGRGVILFMSENQNQTIITAQDLNETRHPGSCPAAVERLLLSKKTSYDCTTGMGLECRSKGRFVYAISIRSVQASQLPYLQLFCFPRDSE